MTAVWDILPSETSSSYAAFKKYLELPPSERSLIKVSTLLGHASKSTVEKWSRTHDWVERAKAYDSHMALTEIEVRRVGLTEAQEALTSSTSAAVTLVMGLATKMAADMREQYMKGEPVDTKSLQRIARVVIDMDTLARRNLGLPTTYKTETVDEPDRDEDVYIIEG